MTRRMFRWALALPLALDVLIALGARARAITEEAMAALVRRDWPGNVR